nr:tetratricopeptide repeat protein [Promineifilum sp.]
VAVPTGVIVGVIVYLIYYALFGRVESDAVNPSTAAALPFAADNLLMNALVAAVLAHYVEIHFGIAISATRLYFFVYVALMFALGHRLRQPALEPEEVSSPPAARGDKRKRRGGNSTPASPRPPSGWERLLIPAALMALMLVLFGYGFITYALPPGKVITGAADLSVGEIIRQSLLQNARRDFVAWPFVLSMIVLSWALGWLVFLGEMIKHGEINFESSGPTSVGRRQGAAGVFLTLALAGIGARFLLSAGTATAVLGLSLALIGGITCALIAVLLLLSRRAARLAGGIVAAALIILAVPVLIAGGGVPALLLIAGGAAALWLLWDDGWHQSLLPAAGAVLLSLVGGFGYIYLHAANYRSLLFYQSQDATSTAMLRALEAAQAGRLLAFFYVFIIAIVFLLALAISWPDIRAERRARTPASPLLVYSSLIGALLLAFFIISQTNVRQVQADMIYKRAQPYESQATRSTQVDADTRRGLWDTAIAIYTTAIDRMPSEDFYYLFLGRAYLERAALTQDPGEQADLLSSAENLLFQAQDLNPLNTDHTANLARLNTRWYAAVTDEAEKSERLALAERYYRLALTLSPQNSVIRNELARLILEVEGDCDRALALYDEAVAIDPFYAQNHLARADAYILCSSGRADAERDTMYQTAAAALEQAVASAPGNIRARVQLAEIYRQLGEYDQAQAAIDDARTQNEPAAFPTAEIDFLAAQIAAGRGDTAEARTLAEKALATAGAETAAQIQAFLTGLGDE